VKLVRRVGRVRVFLWSRSWFRASSRQLVLRPARQYRWSLGQWVWGASVEQVGASLGARHWPLSVADRRSTRQDHWPLRHRLRTHLTLPGRPMRHPYEVYYVFYRTRRNISHCLPAWSGLVNVSDGSRIDAFLRKSKRLGRCDVNTPSVADMFATADDALFSCMTSNAVHVLHAAFTTRPLHAVTTRTFSADVITQNSTHHNSLTFIITSSIKHSYSFTCLCSDSYC